MSTACYFLYKKKGNKTTYARNIGTHKKLIKVITTGEERGEGWEQSANGIPQWRHFELSEDTSYLSPAGKENFLF